MDVIEQEVLDFDNAIKAQIDAIEVGWAFEEMVGRLETRKFSREHIYYWEIGNRVFFAEPHSATPFEIILDEKTFKSFVNVHFQKLGYTRVEAEFPELIEAREKRGLALPIRSSSTIYFQCNTLEDILELFAIIEGSSLCFYC